MSSIVGVDVGGTSTRAVCFDTALVPVATATGPTPRGAIEIVDVVARLVGEVADRPSAVAIGVPGRVDVAGGIVSSAVNLDITRPAPIGELVRQRLGVAVHIENDVNAAALGAFVHIGLAPTRSLAYVNVGTGIAAGFVLAGRLWRGATGASGEIGHVPMQSPGPPCRCGQFGCAEAVGSGRAVSDDPGRRGDVATATAWAVQLCVMTIDVDLVVVGGGMTQQPGFMSGLVTAITAREATSPMLAERTVSGRVVLAPSDVPLGSLGAVLAMRDPAAQGWVDAP